MKKIILTAVALILALALTACGSASSSGTKNATIVVGSLTSDYQVWSYIAKSNAAKKAHLNIQVENINDGRQLNDAVKNGQIDVNAFQSYSYFQDYNKTTHSHLVAFATTYLEPMAIYSKKAKSVSAIKNGATIEVPSDPANTARALLLLRAAGLIKLTSSFNAFGKVSDITANPKHLKIKLVSNQLEARTLPDVDAGVIGNSDAYQAKLNSLTDSIYHEKVDQSTKANVNILVTTAAKAKDKNILKLGELYHNKEIQAYVKKAFGGTKVPVQVPVSSLNN